LHIIDALYEGVHCPGWALRASRKSEKTLRATSIILPIRGDTIPKLIFIQFGKSDGLADIIQLIICAKLSFYIGLEVFV
jgi:hypothetical protein